MSATFIKWWWWWSRNIWICLKMTKKNVKNSAQKPDKWQCQRRWMNDDDNEQMNEKKSDNFSIFFLFKMFVMFLWLANNPICAYDIMFSVSLCMERENILFFPVHQHNVVIKCLDDFFWLLCDDVQTHWETETKELTDWLNIFRNEKKSQTACAITTTTSNDVHVFKTFFFLLLWKWSPCTHTHTPFSIQIPILPLSNTRIHGGGGGGGRKALKEYTHTHVQNNNKTSILMWVLHRKKNTCRVVIWCIHHTHLIQPTKRSTIHTQWPDCVFVCVCYLMMILMIPIINFIARFFFVLLSSTFTMTSLCILYSKTFVISWCHHHQCRDDKQGSRVSFFCCCYRQWMNEWKWFLFSVLFETHTHTHKHHAYLILELFQFLFWWWVMTISQFRIFLFPIYLFFF